MSGSAAGTSTVRIDLPARRAQGERGLHQLLGHRADRRHHDRQQVHEHAQEEERDLLRLADAEPQDEQRDERRDRQVAQRRHDRLAAAG